MTFASTRTNLQTLALGWWRWRSAEAGACAWRWRKS